MVIGRVERGGGHPWTPSIFLYVCNLLWPFRSRLHAVCCWGWENLLGLLAVGRLQQDSNSFWNLRLSAVSSGGDPLKLTSRLDGRLLSGKVRAFLVKDWGRGGGSSSTPVFITVAPLFNKGDGKANPQQVSSLTRPVVTGVFLGKGKVVVGWWRTCPRRRSSVPTVLMNLFPFHWWRTLRLDRDKWSVPTIPTSRGARHESFWISFTLAGDERSPQSRRWPVLTVVHVGYHGE